MNKKIYYLAHPFDSRHDMRVKELDLECTGKIDIVNPFYDIERDDILEIDAGRKERYQVDPAVIVESDLAAIERADGIIAIIDDVSFSCGTMQEIVYAYTLYKKHVILLVRNGHEQHPWLQYHSHKIFTVYEELKKYIEENM